MGWFVDVYVNVDVDVYASANVTVDVSVDVYADVAGVVDVNEIVRGCGCGC